MEITLIRHTNVAVPSGIVYGATDVDVALTFKEEAQIVASNITGKKFDAVYCSPLTRCRKLATFCGYPTPIIDTRLKELNFGKWEMLPWNKINDPLMEKWYADWVNIPAGEGESFREQYLRVADFLDELKQQPFDKICLFAHSGTIRCIRIYIGISDFENAFSDDIPFGNISTIHISKKQ